MEVKPNDDLVFLQSLAFMGGGRNFTAEIYASYKRLAARDKAYQVIKAKSVDVYWLKRSASLEDYNRIIEDPENKLTQEEFTFLKEEIQK